MCRCCYCNEKTDNKDGICDKHREFLGLSKDTRVEDHINQEVAAIKESEE